MWDVVRWAGVAGIGCGARSLVFFLFGRAAFSWSFCWTCGECGSFGRTKAWAEDEQEAW